MNEADTPKLRNPAMDQWLRDNPDLARSIRSPSKPMTGQSRKAGKGTEQFSVLYHGTSSKHIKSIIAVGLTAPTHWGSLEVAKYFARGTCVDHGGKPVLIAKPFSAFYSEGFQVDEQMVDFPVLTDIRGADHGVLADQWNNSKQDWTACLRIFEAVVYNATVAIERTDFIR